LIFAKSIVWNGLGKSSGAKKSDEGEFDNKICHNFDLIIYTKLAINKINKFLFYFFTEKTCLFALITFGFFFEPWSFSKCSDN
jgi:hypothetical protein